MNHRLFNKIILGLVVGGIGAGCVPSFVFGHPGSSAVNAHSQKSTLNNTLSSGVNFFKKIIGFNKNSPPEGVWQSKPSAAQSSSPASSQGMFSGMKSTAAKVGDYATKFTERVAFAATNSAALDVAKRLQRVNAQIEFANQKLEGQGVDRLARVDGKLKKKQASLQQQAVRAYADLKQAHAAVKADIHRSDETKVKLLEQYKAQKALLKEAFRDVKSEAKKQSAAKAQAVYKQKINRAYVAVHKSVTIGVKKAWKGLRNSVVGQFFKTPENMAHTISLLAAKGVMKNTSEEFMGQELTHKILAGYSDADKARIWEKVSQKITKKSIVSSENTGSGGKEAFDVAIAIGLGLLKVAMILGAIASSPLMLLMVLDSGGGSVGGSSHKGNQENNVSPAPDFK